MIKRIALRTTIVLLVLLLSGGLVWFNFFRDAMIADFFAKMPQPVVTVSATDVARGPWNAQIEAIGTAKASKGVDLAVQTSGVVKEILVKPNDRVNAGQVILRIDDAVERAQLRAAEADLQLAQVKLNRQSELRERGVAAQANYDEAVAQVAAARSALDRLRALLDQKVIAAPFAGIIGIPRLDVGAYVQPGTVISSLQDLDTMLVDFTVPEQSATRLRAGLPVLFRAGPQAQTFKGTIIGIDPKVDSRTRLVSVRAEVANTDGSMRPGEFVHASVQMPGQDGVIALPQTAVVTSLYGDYIYRLEKGEDGTLRARQVFVKVGRRSGGMIEVTEGIEPGQTIATSGQNKLQNGTPVTIDNSVDPAALARASQTQGAQGVALR